MDEAEIRMHRSAGETYGREATCGEKINYRGEESATKAAIAMTLRHGRTLEPYPCFWCDGWHIGRAMTLEERARFS
jgi:hypothetical protein